MAELTTLARPYAKAAFEVARGKSELALWAESLDVAASVAGHEKIKNLLEAPALTSKQKSDSLLDVLGLTKNQNFCNFVQTLAENQRLTLLPEIRALFLAFKAQQEKSVEVSISSAVAISDALKESFVSALAKKLERDIVISTNVDQDLIGGAVIRAGDMVIDGSVKGRLSKLSESINA